MDKMLNSVLNYVNTGDKVVAGVSGGADSMVMLHLLKQATTHKNFNLLVVHIEHGIREIDSKNDADFVAKYCKTNNIDYKVYNLKVLDLAKTEKQTIEECARNQRIKIFDAYIKKGYKLFLAHNKDDNAETILMHIFRGSGIDGARGIVKKDNVYRPLLNFTKEEILNVAKMHQIKFVEDCTNADTNYSRNFIRHNIITKIKEIYPNITDNLVKFADFCSSAEQLVAENINPTWLNKKDGIVYLNSNALISNKLVSAKLIKQAYNLCGEFYDLESKHIDFVHQLNKTNKNGSIINLPHGVVAEKRDNYLLFYKTSQIQESCNFKIGRTQLEGTIIDVKVATLPKKFEKNKFYLDLDKIPDNALFRTRRSGDMFQKLGSTGKKKLNDYFTDKKLNKSQRDNQIVLANGNTILLVLDLDTSELVKVDSSTKNIVTIEKINK